MPLRIDLVGAVGPGGAQFPIDGPGARLVRGELLLGSLPSRSPSLALPSRRNLVAREHALIYLSDADGAWHLKDLGSETGTWLLPALTRVVDLALRGTTTFALGDAVLRASVIADG